MQKHGHLVEIHACEVRGSRPKAGGRRAPVAFVASTGGRAPYPFGDVAIADVDGIVSPYPTMLFLRLWLF